jgi:hypothetical protein
MGDAQIAALLAEGAIERVPADAATADQELVIAERHLASAAALAASDPVGAFALGYDGVRKAITAHMRACGYRTRSSAGHHRRIGRYAVAALDVPGVAAHIEMFDRLRRLRNQSQYEGLDLESDEVAELLEHARPIIVAIKEDLTR